MEEIWKEWHSSMEVEKQLGFCRSCICRCLRGNKKTAYGYLWSYKNI